MSLVTAVLVLAGSTSAAPRSHDLRVATNDEASVEQRADALFKQGRALLKAERFADACSLFQQSLALDPALGTLLNLADCLERAGKTLSAWQYFNEAATWADRNHEPERSEVARTRAAALKTKLAWVALAPPDLAHSITVRVNQQVIQLGATPQSVPVDAGDVVVEASADGFERWVKTGRVAAGETLRLDVPALVSHGTPGGAAHAQPTTAALKLQPAPAPSRPSAVGIGVMSAGAALLITGVAGLVWSFSTYQRYQPQRLSNGETPVTPYARGDFDTLRVLYPCAWVATALGLAALGGGLSWMLTPTRSGAVASVGGSF